MGSHNHDKPNTVVCLRLYTASLESEPIAATEVEELTFLNTRSYTKHSSDLTKQLFDWLYKNDYIG